MVTDVCSGEKKEQEPKVACESVASTDGPAPGTQRVKTWGNDSVDEQKRWNWHTKAGWKMSWTLSLQRIWLRTCQATKQQAKAFAGLPIWKWTPWMKKHLFAVLLVFLSTVVPMCILGASTQVSMSSVPFSNIFGDKVLSCGDSIGGEPQNATVTGIEKLFALDLTFGKFSFAQVKTIDIVWDLAIGRGLQVLAWWAAYIVFCDALLRAIERHPASFSIFQRIALEGPGLHSMWSLTKELWAAKSRRTKALFFYMFWSTAYVLFVPIVLGAMTGYDSTAIAWVDLDGSNNIIPASTLKSAWIITGTKNETWSEGTCESWELSSKFSRIKSHRKYVCNCQLPNGTILSPLEENQRFNNYHYTYGYYSNPPYLECKYNYPNQTKTWEDSISGSTYSCNATVPVTIKGKEYDLDDLSTTSGWCYNSVAYNDTYLMGRSRCLPDTANQTYEWGFSTLMSGMFVFVTTGWAITMYIVWMDAQLNSSLVREGYRMTPLRAAFTIARAARRRMGMNDKALVRADTAALEKELYGKKGKKKTRIEYSIFAEDPEDGEDGWAKPPVRWPSSPQSSSTAQSEAGCGLLGENSVGSPVSSTPHGIDVLPGTQRDEELRMRYQKGVQEAMLSRKPVGK